MINNTSENLLIMKWRLSTEHLTFLNVTTYYVRYSPSDLAYFYICEQSPLRLMTVYSVFLSLSSMKAFYVNSTIVLRSYKDSINP